MVNFNTSNVTSNGDRLTDRPIQVRKVSQLPELNAGNDNGAPIAYYTYSYVDNIGQEHVTTYEIDTSNAYIMVAYNNKDGIPCNYKLKLNNIVNFYQASTTLLDNIYKYVSDGLAYTVAYIVNILDDTQGWEDLPGTEPPTPPYKYEWNGREINSNIENLQDYWSYIKK